MDCIFCKIINKELNSEIIDEDESIIVFKDIHPRAPVHFLIVPKEHLGSVKDEGAEDWARHLLVKAKVIAKTRGIDDYKLVFNVGKEAGQTVEHLHLHFLAGGPAELTI